MKRARHFVLVALAPFVAWCADVSADPAFARYRSIIDRMPFGEPPPNFDPTLAPGSAAAAAAAATAAAAGGMTEEQRTEEEQKLASSVRVSVLNVTPAGRTMVGFTDSSAKPPEHYYLPVGGERDGWSVKSADPATEKVTLAKGELEVTLKLGEGSTGNAKDGTDGKQKSSSPRSLLHGRRLGPKGANLANGPTGGGQAPVAGGQSNVAGGAMARLRERRFRQLQEEQAENERRAAAAAEEKAERERRAVADAVAAEQAAAELEQQRAEREQQRADLQQIREELRRQREEKEKQRAQNQEETEG